jgi:hypothetical protein
MVDLSDDDRAPQIQRKSDRCDRKRSQDKRYGIEILNQPVPESIQRLVALMRETENKRK